MSLVACLRSLASPSLRIRSLHAPHCAPALKTYTSPDGSFRFTYPDLLIECEKREQPGGYTWVQKECSAYFPTCDQGIGLNQNEKTVACFAYPRNDHSDSDTFEAATFSIARINDIADERGCLSPSLDQIDIRKGTARIHGARFAVFERGEGGMSQAVGATVYRTFHSKQCYQLAITQATASAAAFDPPPRELTKEDWTAIYGSLRQALSSFRFLK